MQTTRTHERIQTIFRELFDDPGLTVHTTTTADDIEEWDSLSHVNLVLQIEQEFGIRFALGEMQALKNVGDMLALIERKRR